MSATLNLFDRLNIFLEKLPGRKDLNPQDEVEKKYMYIQGIISLTFLIIMGIVAWSISAKLVRDFCEVFFVVMTIGTFFIYYPRKIGNTILILKMAMIIVSSIYIIKMGGLYTSGGLFLIAIQAVTSSIILRKFWKIIVVASTFVIFMTILIAFQSYFPTENLLTPKQNKIIFSMNLFGITTYITFFSLYAINLLTTIERRETQRQKELNDAKTRLYTNVTHEFRTPLTVILGMADSTKNNGNDNISEKMDVIVKNGKSLLKLVNQLLDMSKLESGRIAVNKITTNIIPFLKYVFELQEFYAEEKNITMFFSSESQSYEIEFDPDKTATIVSNLLNNAIKFTPDNGQISMKVNQTGENISIEIKDNGIGIPNEKLETIFDRFYQVDDKNTRKEGGAGIGLALTREFVELLGGSINVKSNPGIGTIFTVKLPYIKGSKKPAFTKYVLDNHGFNEGLKVPDNSNDSSIKINQRLLIIEDNPDVIGYLKACYESHFKITIAADGAEGYSRAIEEIPDIIVSDIMMPKMDGFELCEKLKSDFRTSHIPIILLTAKADVPSRIEGLEKGADAYVIKPFNQQELLVRIRKLLELRKKLFQRYSNGNGFELSNNPVVQKEDAFFKKLKETIEQHLHDEDYNIQLICEELGMSKSQLYRKFNALTNKPIAKYIRTLRMQKAKELLQTTTMNITEVGYKVGMKSLSTFSQIFKEEFGESPREYANHFQETHQ